MKKTQFHTCPSCGYEVFSEPLGSYEICNLCGWEDDPLQLANPFSSGGANSASLYENQKLFEEQPNNVSVKGFTKDKNWRKLNDSDKEIFLTEDKWKNKPIFNLSKAYWQNS